MSFKSKISKINFKFIKRRLIEELRNPNNRIFYILINMIYTIFNFLIFKKRKGDKSYLIWDIRVNSITFDFISVIFYTFNNIKFKDKKKFDVVIYIPESFNPEPFHFGSYNEIISASDNIKRIKNLIIPLANNFNCVDNIIVETKLKNIYKYLNNSFDVFPKNYHPKFFIPEPLHYRSVIKYLLNGEKKIPLIKSEELNQDIYNDLGTIIKPKEYITITLRDYGYMPHRNTSNKDIEKAYQLSLELNKKLILVLDKKEYISKYHVPNGALISKLPRESIRARNAIYANSEVNLFKESGPAYLSHYLNKIKTIIIDFCDGGPDSNLSFYKYLYNIEIGDQPYLKLNGYLLWKEIHRDYKLSDLMFAYKYLSPKDYR